MNKRKFFGTILGILFWSVCVVFFTFAYYEWKSENTSIVLGINDLSTKCMPGTDVNVENIGPVLNYQDGVKAEFSIENGMNKEMVIDLRLDIENISDNLLTKSFKYVVVTDTTGNETPTYDYANPVLEGDFTNFKVGSNIITTSLVLTPSITQKFLFIVYIDGNMKNDPNMQNNSLVANLMIGNCEENATTLSELQYQAIYSSDDNSLTFIYNKPVTVGETYNNKVVTAVYTGFEDTKYNSASAVPWSSVKTNITSVTFEESISPISTAYWFYGFSNLTSINLEKLDTSRVTGMGYMFYGCKSLTSLDLSNFDTSNVTSMGCMFQDCSSLESLDVSTWNTAKVTNSMRSMFCNCSSLKKLDVSKWDTSNVTSMVSMFYNCSSLENLDVSNWDTSNVTSMNGQYASNAMFYNCKSLTELDVSKWDTSNVTSMLSMFNNCSSLENLDVSNWDTSNVTNMKGMFYNCSSLTSLDLSNWDTSNVTNMGLMFVYCSSLSSLDVSNFDTSSVTHMAAMFRNCSSLTSLDVSNFDTSNVKTMGDIYGGMFDGCSSLTSLDLSNFDTSNVTGNGMMYLFRDCSSLTELNVSSFDTSKITNMQYMFEDCSNLTNLNLSNWDTSNLTSMLGTFVRCTKLSTTIIIRSTSITNYDSVFKGAATAEGASIIVKYVADNPNTTDVNESTESLVEAMIRYNSNVIPGGCIGDYCPVEETGEEEVTE